MKSRFLVAIDIGGTNLKFGLFSSTYKLIHKKSLPTGSFCSKEAIVAALACETEKLLKEFKISKSNVEGVGIGVPGPVDSQKGLVYFLPNIPGWHNVNLARSLESKLNFPVFLDNDAKLMCLAEFTLGAAHGYQNALCLTLGTGIGSGLVINGALYRGANNGSGELGHMPLNEHGPQCGCGSFGCLESYLGNNKLLLEARRVFGKQIQLEDITKMANNKNKKAIAFWDQVGCRLGTSLSGVVNLLNLDVIVIGGGVANAGKFLFDAVRQTVAKRAMSIQAKHVKIVKAALSEDAGLIGAAIVAQQGVKR